jgi:hypothetical protein
MNIVESVKYEWNSEADENNQWDSLSWEEREKLIIKRYELERSIDAPVRESIVNYHKEIQILADHIWNWCKAIDENGGGWDYWDHYFKMAWYWEKEDVYKIIRKYVIENEGEEK